LAGRKNLKHNKPLAKKRDEGILFFQRMADEKTPQARYHPGLIPTDDNRRSCAVFFRGAGMTPWLTVTGIGEDGFKGLGKNARMRFSSVAG
jgi:hypothetical protein